MSRYQPPPYQDSPARYGDEGYGQSYGNNASGNNYGGYSDEPGYNNYGNGSNAAQAGNRGQSYPMGPTNPYAATSPSGGYVPKKKRNKWLWIGIPVVAILIIVGAVLGGVLGSRAADKKGGGSGSGSGSGSGGGGNTGLPSGVSGNSEALTATGANGQKYLAVATDSEWMLPVYATGTVTSGYAEPTTLSNAGADSTWPADPSPPSNSSIRDHPRLIAPAYKWQALQTLIPNNLYLKQWNDTIIANASSTLSDSPEAYTEDGGLSGSGVLDVARRVKLKVKNWSYAYRMTNDTKYADRVWLELQNCAGNTSNPFGADDGTRWNPAHFLDLAEFSAAYAIGYDWVYDHWTDDQRDSIMWSIINLGLHFGQLALQGDSSASSYYWWTGNPTQINGNWNCVCNGGLTMAALAIRDRDPTGIAESVLSLTVPNAFGNCFQGARGDGTWAETANYWYFGTTGAAEMASSLITAYGDDRGLSASNPGWALTSLFHIYSQGMTSLFNYGDHGPNKYSSTANSLMLWGSLFNDPRYTLYQRDQYDTSEPWSMFWYDPSVSGTWWDGLSLDHYFQNATDEWACARTNWPDLDGAYWAMKSGALEGHQTHGDLDIGDFVLDAMGQRWFGELGSGQYLADGYFSSEAQNSERWLYYRKRTDGQNTLYVNYQNQNVNAAPTSNWGTTGTTQGPAPSFNLTTTDTAFFTTDMTSAYNSTIQRGIRFLNGRRQILLQDDVNVPANTDVMWRAHTNATVTVSSDGSSASLALGGQTLEAKILSGPSGAKFTTMDAVRLSQDPPLPNGGQGEDADQPNDGVTVLVIDTPAGGTFSLQVLFNPQWSGLAASDYVTPPGVNITAWSLTSHN